MRCSVSVGRDELDLMTESELGDALIELDRNATKMIGNWTPSNN